VGADSVMPRPGSSGSSGGGISEGSQSKVVARCGAGGGSAAARRVFGATSGDGELAGGAHRRGSGEERESESETLV
jgi:hypothetical protein